MKPQDIINFWFSPPQNQLWFASTPAFDQQIRDQFERVWQQASNGLLDDWQKDAIGCLALVILLDQFPLNMFRGQPQSFSTEQQAVAVSKKAIDKGFDQVLQDSHKVFLYMPFMHSESIEDQNQSVALFENAVLKDNVRFAVHHRDIVSRFGRFPHRNAILGRQSSQAEIDYLHSKEAFKG